MNLRLALILAKFPTPTYQALNKGDALHVMASGTHLSLLTRADGRTIRDDVGHEDSEPHLVQQAQCRLRHLSLPTSADGRTVCEDVGHETLMLHLPQEPRCFAPTCASRDADCVILDGVVAPTSFARTIARRPRSPVKPLPYATSAWMSQH